MSWYLAKSTVCNISADGTNYPIDPKTHLVEIKSAHDLEIVARFVADGTLTYAGETKPKADDPLKQPAS